MRVVLYQLLLPLCAGFYCEKSGQVNRQFSINSRKKISRSNLLIDMYDDDDLLLYKQKVDERGKMKKEEGELFAPSTFNQGEYYNMIQDENIKMVIASGPAGTGKTLFPTQYAAKLLMLPGEKVIVTRPLICVDEELGYLPGGINQKMDPWTIPIFDILREYFTQQMLDKFIAEKKLEVVPLAFMRGRTFKNTFIIGDELQNTSINQMLMLLTRIGENSKIIITGDVNQCDHTENGLLDLVTRVEDKYNKDSNINFVQDLKGDAIALVQMTTNDVQRSELVTTILNIYDKNT